MEQQRRPATLRTVTPEVLEEVRRLISEADHASLGSLDPGTGWPLVSRVGLATMPDGTPLIFVSALAAHQAALIADRRSSLLIGSIGKGDPLAHPRVTLQCEALMIEPGTETAAMARERYLERHKRAGMYIDLPDFRFFRLTIVRASFNGGFGRAYEIGGSDLLVEA